MSGEIVWREDASGASIEGLPIRIDHAAAGGCMLISPLIPKRHPSLTVDRFSYSSFVAAKLDAEGIARWAFEHGYGAPPVPSDEDPRLAPLAELLGSSIGKSCADQARAVLALLDGLAAR